MKTETYAEKMARVERELAERFAQIGNRMSEIRYASSRHISGLTYVEERDRWRVNVGGEFIGDFKTYVEAIVALKKQKTDA